MAKSHDKSPRQTVTPNSHDKFPRQIVTQITIAKSVKECQKFNFSHTLNEKEFHVLCFNLR